MAIPVGTAIGYLDLDYSKFSKKLDTAITEANGLSNKFSDTLGSGLSTIGGQLETVGMKMTTSITLPLAAATGAAIKFGAEFDKGMANVKAVSGATSEEFQEMRNAAIDWGEKTVYTAAEASDALYYMGLAGWDANNSISALGPVLNLAAAGNLELGRTSDIVTDAMTALKLEADEYTNGVQNAEHFTNVLAATMANSNTDVDQLGEAFKYVAPLAGAAGMESEDLSLALGLMANVGVKASQAGTGLRQALKSVISPTDKAAGVMEKYGVSLFDAEGKAKSMRQFMYELRDTFGDLAIDVYDANGELKTAEQIMEEYGHSLPTSQQEKLNAIVQIFGTRALPGVLGIIEQSDEKFESLANAIDGSDKAFVKFGNEFMTYQEAVDKYGESLVNTSKDFEILGYSTGMAEIQMDNLKGDWIKFTSALGTTKIEITDLVNGALRQFVQKITDLVRWFNDLSDEEQKHILKIVGMVAAIGPALLVFGKLVRTVGNTITAFSTIGGAITKLNVGFGLINGSVTKVWRGFKLARLGATGLAQGMSPLGAALGTISAPMIAIAALIAALIGMFVHLMKTNEEFRNKIIAVWDGIKAKFEESGKKILDTINKLGFDFTSLGEAIKAAFDWVSNKLAPLFVSAFKTIGEVVNSLIDIFTGLFEIIGGLIIGFKDGDWSTFTQGIKDFAFGLFDLLTAPFRMVFNVISEYLESFGTSWENIWNTVVRFFYDVVMSIIMKFNEIKHNISTWWEETLTGFLEFHTNLWNAIGDFLYNAVMSVIRFFADLKHSYEQFKENAKQKVRDLIMELLARFAFFVADTKRKYEELKSSVVEIFNTIKTKVERTIRDMVMAVIAKISSMKRDIINKATEIKNGIINVFSGIKEKFTEVGSNIVQGIWNGISSGWQWLTDKVSSLAKSLLDSAKNALGIHSPSRAFEDDFGYWLPLGAAEGVDDSMPKAIRQIQKSFTDGLSQITGNIDLENPLFALVNTTKSMLESTTIWFETIEERLYDVVNAMKSDLVELMQMGQLVVNADGTISGLVYDRPSTSLKPLKNADDNSGNVTNNFYYTFNSPKAIDEIEAARKMKETQRDLSEGF